MMCPIDEQIDAIRADIETTKHPSALCQLYCLLEKLKEKRAAGVMP